MFRRIRDSQYFRWAVTIVVSGALLIIFSSWIRNRQLSIGFEAVNRTLAPVYIGVIFAFILCPVYNFCVRKLYAALLEGAQKRGFSVGPTLMIYQDDTLKPDGTDKKRLLTASKAAASVICVLIVTGLVGLVVYFVLPQLLQSVFMLVSTMPQRLSALSAWLSTHFSRFPQLAKWVDSVANAGVNDVLKWMQKNVLQGDAMNVANTISSGVVAAVKYVLNAVIGLLIMVYLLNYKDNLLAMARKVISATCGQKRKESLYEFGSIVNETFIGFIVGRIIDSFIIGVLTFIVLTICNISFALMISVIVGITNVIPFFGPFIGAVPSVMLLMLEDPLEAFYFIIIILIIQQLDGNVIGPRIVGDVLGINSFWVLIAVLVGGGLFGFQGMVFGVPVFAVIYRYVNKMIRRSLENKGRPVSTADYFDLKPYGIEDEEVELEAKKKKEKGSILKFGKGREKEDPDGAAPAAEREENNESAD